MADVEDQSWILPRCLRGPSNTREFRLFIVSLSAGMALGLAFVMPFWHGRMLSYLTNIELLKQDLASFKWGPYIAVLLVSAGVVFVANYLRSRLEDRDEAIMSVAIIPFDQSKTNDEHLSRLYIQTNGCLDHESADRLMANSRQHHNNK